MKVVSLYTLIKIALLFSTGGNADSSPKKKYTLSADAPVFVPKFAMQQQYYQVFCFGVIKQTYMYTELNPNRKRI